jgi:hypothetical protein
MAVYLDEEMIGLDSDVIGFPHILLCMGFVTLFENASGELSLSGIHLSNPAKAQRAFPFFVNELFTSGKPKMHAIYGSCNWDVRYEGAGNQRAAWRDEMMSYAKQLGFNGPARGFNTGVIAPKDGTYVEYDLNRYAGFPVRIFYKRNERMIYTEGGAKLPKVMFAAVEEEIPEELRGNLRLLAKRSDRIESVPSKGGATIRPKKFGVKNRKLTELDYALCLETQYVYASSSSIMG